MLRAQFTYTASSRPGPYNAGAGWKVTAVTAGTPVPEEVVRRAARNVGGFVPPALPELASRADVDALPHCLRLDLLDGTEAAGGPLACLSHIVAAGPDYSGRPNLFAHGLVVSADGLVDERGGHLRPADLWDAGVWLRPLGSREAEESRPDEQLQVLTRGPLGDAVLDAFSRDHPNQRGLVLAAVERRLLGGGPLVVVGDTSFSSVATWLHLVGRLLLPASAWRLPFSTYERLRDARGADGWPFAVVGVPTADAAAATALPGHRFTVLRDEDRPVQATRERWTMHDGTELAAGPWARLAEAVVTSGFLPVAADQVEDLARSVGDSTRDRPLWALGAAVLLDEDLAEFFGADAAEVVAEHWPGSLGAEGMAERLVQRVGEYAAPRSRALERIAARAGADPAGADLAGADLDGVVARRAPLQPVRTAPAPTDDVDRYAVPEVPAASPAVRAELDELLSGALDEVPRAADPVRALLAVAGQVDGAASDVELRLRTVELAREFLVPRLVEPTADPAGRGWEPVPAWLWNTVVPALAAVPGLERGTELPGRNLAAAVHEWLGPLSLPAGELTTDALAGTGPVEWERAAYRLYVRRAPDVTPLERAAAFLRTVHCAAANEGTPVDRWAGRAAEDAYKRPPLDLATALVLMDVLPPDVPFATTLAGVLQRTWPGPDAGAAVERLYDRETVPDTVGRLLERHRRAAEPVAVPAAARPSPVLTVETSVPSPPPAAGRPAAPGELLVTSPRTLGPLLSAAQRAGALRTAWVPLAEALLRIDVRVLPMAGLPASLWADTMPWGDGWARLDAEQTDSGARTRLAAHLLCRGARARWWRREDCAADWLTEDGEDRHTVWAETIARRLLLRGDPRLHVEELVRVLTEQAPRKPLTASPDSRRREDGWRDDALVWARRLAAVKPRPSSAPRDR